MAKGIDILGTLRGKRGGVVYYRSGGAQLSRPRVTPRNPKSAKQAVQRMVLASAAKLAGALSPIVNHSFEGVQHGNASINHFRKGVMTQMRGAAAAYFGGGSNNTICNFVLKGAPTIPFVPGCVISRGTLICPTPVFNANLDVLITGRSGVNGNIDSQDTYEEVLGKLGLLPGDQLTLVLVHRDLNQPVATLVADGQSQANYLGYVSFCRVTFTSTFDADEPVSLLSSPNWHPALVESIEGSWPTLRFQDEDSISILTSADSTIVEAALIRSQKQENGSFKYSTSSLVSTEELLDSNDAWPSYLSYMEGAQIEVGDNLYLQNATN